MFAFNQPLGRLLRAPLRLIPPSTIVRVVSGPNRGMRWIVGSGNHTYWLGNYARNSARLIQSLVRPGMMAFDAGANAGYFTLLLSKMVGPTGSVFSFEPDPTNAAYLRRHVSMNSLTNVTLIEAALSDRSGTAYFKSNGNQGHISSSGRASVRTARLDDFPVPDFIKMDIEGAEIVALGGAKSTLAARRTSWLVDLHVERSLIEQTFSANGLTVHQIPGEYGLLATPASPLI